VKKLRFLNDIYYRNDALGVANLMMSQMFFPSPIAPKLLKALDAIIQPPEAGGPQLL
jgi:hypothetical protein